MDNCQASDAKERSTQDPIEEKPSSRSPATEAVERLKNAAGENVKRLREAAEAGYQAFRESEKTTDNESRTSAESQTWEELCEKLKDLHEEVEIWTRENPTAAILTAAGIGLVLGLLLKK